VGTPPAVLGASCNSCHGPVGVGITPIYPTLSGQHADYLAYAMESYRNGARKNGIMQPFVAQLQPAEIEAIAAFYAQQKPTLQTVPLKEKTK
jgi:cytochrome c553